MHMMSKGDIYHANCATIYNWWCIPNAKRERERKRETNEGPLIKH